MMCRCILFLIILSSACLPKTYFNQSFSSSERLPVTADGYVALPSGESLDASIILQTEKITPKEIHIVKVHGTFLLAADGFKNVWAIFPVSDDKGKVKMLSVLKENEQLSDVEFEVISRSRCIILKFQVGKSPGQYL